jgi:hypothetical protein
VSRTKLNPEEQREGAVHAQGEGGAPQPSSTGAPGWPKEGEVSDTVE